MSRADVVADLKQRFAVYRLPGQSAISDELTTMGFDDPKPEAEFTVAADISGNPLVDLISVECLPLERHQLRITPDVQKQVDVFRCHFSKSQATRGLWNH